MWCLRSSSNRRRGAVPVYLNVYDLTSMNGYAYWFGLGVYHSGVQVHGIEYAFGAHEQSLSGIFEGEPRQCARFTFRKSILVGWTDMTPGEVKGVLRELGLKYRGISYNLITNNCNHFCNEVCVKLTGNPIPKWVNRLARLGLLCHCMIPTTLDTTKIVSNRVGDKEFEVKKKKLKSQSNKSPSSASDSTLSLSSSSCSPPTAAAAAATRRGERVAASS